MVNKLIAYINQLTEKFLFYIKKNMLTMVFLIIIFITVFFSVNSFIQSNAHERKLVFTKQIKEIIKLSEKNKTKEAIALLRELNQQRLLTDKQIYLLQYLETKLTSKLPKNDYQPTAIEYEDSSLFGDLLLDKQFLFLMQNKLYEQIKHKYLTLPCQSHSSVVPLLTYLKALYETQQKDIVHTYMTNKLYTSDSANQELLEQYFQSLIWGISE